MLFHFQNLIINCKPVVFLPTIKKVHSVTCATNDTILSFMWLIFLVFVFNQLQIDAHRSPLAAMVLSSNGMYIATASEQGTIIRVHLVSDATKVVNHVLNFPSLWQFSYFTA